VLLYGGLALGAYLLLKDSGIGKGIDRAAEGVGTAVGAAGDLVASAAHMIELTLTWPEKLYEYVRWPETEKAKFMYGELFPQLIKACGAGALSEASLFLGYDERLAVLDRERKPFSDGHRSGGYDEKLGFVIPRSKRQIELGSTYIGPGEWDMARTCAVHATDPLVMCDGLVYGVDPKLTYLLDIIRYGQSQDQGFNIWPDGSTDHPREGWCEGWLMTTLLRSLYENIPIGFTQGRVLARHTTPFCQHFEKPGAPPICPSGFPQSVGYLEMGWPVKYLWPASSKGFTDDSSHMPRRCFPWDGGDSPECCIGWLVQPDGTFYVPGNCKINDSRNFMLTVSPNGPDALPGDSRTMRSVDITINLDGRNSLDKPTLDPTAGLAGITPLEGRLLVYPKNPPDWYVRLSQAHGFYPQYQAALKKG
jgi:hypothetical protein